MFDIKDPVFWFNLAFALAGLIYGIYIYFKKKNLTPIMKLTTLMLEVLQDGVITPDEWELILKTAKEIIPIQPTVENIPSITGELTKITAGDEVLYDKYDAEEHIDKMASKLEDFEPTEQMTGKDFDKIVDDIDEDEEDLFDVINK